MKKFIIAAVMTVSLAFTAMADTWINAGFNAANLWDKRTTSSIVTEQQYFMPGLYLNLNTFKNKSLMGLWLHGDLVFPGTCKTTVNNSSTERNISDMWNDTAIDYGFIVGPMFRIPLGSFLDFYLGAGFALNFQNYKRSSTVFGVKSETEFFAMNLGLGADVGVKLNFSKNIYINGGLNANWFWSSYETTTTKVGANVTQQKGWTDSTYSSWAIKPYVGAGFAF